VVRLAIIADEACANTRASLAPEVLGVNDPLAMDALVGDSVPDTHVDDVWTALVCSCCGVVVVLR
jgi:hypothetical protein